MRLGCIADDYTGSTDLASALAEAGMRVRQLFGVPAAGGVELEDDDAVVIALKIRNLPARLAVEQAEAALDWLRARSVETVMFKYCSTFDSTSAGNIGPVHDALLHQLGADQSVSTPATPENGRTVYFGHLFVGAQLVSESGMRNHPLTPMTDPLLVRVLASQSSSDIRLLPLPVVRSGVSAVRDYLAELRLATTGPQIVLCDATEDADLDTVARATSLMQVVAGAAGLGRAVAKTMAKHTGGPELPPAAATASEGPTAVLAGSCSSATLEQVEAMAQLYPSFRLGAEQLADSPDLVDRVVRWAEQHLRHTPILIAASQPADQVAQAQRRLGADRAAELVEGAFATIARELRRLGVRRLVVAGGETSGAVVNALDLREVRVGPALAPGVPWIYTEGAEPLLLALKSGNFGGPSFLIDAAAGELVHA